MNKTDYNIGFICDKTIDYKGKLQIQLSLPVDLISFGVNPHHYYMSTQACILLQQSPSWFDKASKFYKDYFNEFYLENTKKLGNFILYSTKFIFVMMTDIPITQFNAETAAKLRSQANIPMSIENLSLKQLEALASLRNGQKIQILEDQIFDYQELLDCLSYAMLCDDNRWAKYLYGLGWGSMVAINPRFEMKSDEAYRKMEHLYELLVDAVGRGNDVRFFGHQERSPQGHNHLHLLISITKREKGSISTIQNTGFPISELIAKVFGNCNTHVDAYNKKELGAFYTVKRTDLGDADYFNGTRYKEEVEYAKEKYKVVLDNKKQNYLASLTALPASDPASIWLPFALPIGIAA